MDGKLVQSPMRGSQYTETNQSYDFPYQIWCHIVGNDYVIHCYQILITDYIPPIWYYHTIMLSPSSSVDMHGSIPQNKRSPHESVYAIVQDYKFCELLSLY